MSLATTYPSRSIASGGDVEALGFGPMGFVETLWIWFRSYFLSLENTSHDADATCPCCGGLMRRPNAVPFVAYPQFTHAPAASDYGYAAAYPDFTVSRKIPVPVTRQPHLPMKRQICLWRLTVQAHAQSKSLWAYSVPLCGAPLSPD